MRIYDTFSAIHINKMEHLTKAWEHLNMLRELMRDLKVDVLNAEEREDSEEEAYFRIAQAYARTLAVQVSSEIEMMLEELASATKPPTGE